MKIVYPKFRTALLMFALGLSSVAFFNWVSDYLNEARVDLPQVESKLPIIVLPKYGAEVPEVDDIKENCKCIDLLVLPNYKHHKNLQK